MANLIWWVAVTGFFLLHAQQEELVLGDDGLDEKVYDESKLGDEDVYWQSLDLLGGDGLDEKVYDDQQQNDAETETLVEEVRDVYNCLTEEGYTWCETLVKCVNSVEECIEETTIVIDEETKIEIDEIVVEEPETPFGGDGDYYLGWPYYYYYPHNDEMLNLGGDEDENGCLSSAGYSYCEKKNDCIQPWLLEGEWDDECTVSTVSLGGERDENGCLGSAGYSYCEKKDDCIRPWLYEGDWEDECTNKNDQLEEDEHVCSEGWYYCEMEDACVLEEYAYYWDDVCTVKNADGFSDYLYNDDGTFKPWVYPCLSGLIIIALVMLLCLVCAKKRRIIRQRRCQEVQMLAEDNPVHFTRFKTNDIVFQETVAVKDTTKTAVPNSIYFTNLV